MLVDPSNKIINFDLLHFRGVTNFDLEQFRAAFEDFSDALKINDKNAKLLSLRAQVHYKFNEFEDCIIDAEESLKFDTCDETRDETRKLIDFAKVSLKFAKCRSPFKVLEISETVDIKQVKDAFGKISSQFHRDKHPNATACDKIKLIRKSQEVRNAYDDIMKQLSSNH